jgi:Spy/CpxP family protein refolding chaperone
MSLYGKLKGACLGLVIALACGTGAAFAQQSATPQQEDGQMRREGLRGERGGKRGDRHMAGMMRLLREVNLTDAQDLQVRAALERFAESTKPQREAFRQLHEQGDEQQGAPSAETREQARRLRGELREAMQRTRTEILAILTPEQRTKFEQLEQERKARHEQWRGRPRAEQEKQ